MESAKASNSKAVEESKGVSELQSLLDRKAQIESEHQVLTSRVREVDKIVNELDERKLRQLEARNIHLSEMTKLESEYNSLVVKINEMSKDK